MIPNKSRSTVSLKALRPPLITLDILGGLSVWKVIVTSAGTSVAGVVIGGTGVSRSSALCGWSYKRAYSQGGWIDVEYLWVEAPEYFLTSIYYRDHQDCFPFRYFYIHHIIINVITNYYWYQIILDFVQAYRSSLLTMLTCASIN